MGPELLGSQRFWFCLSALCVMTQRVMAFFTSMVTAQQRVPHQFLQGFDLLLHMTLETANETQRVFFFFLLNEKKH
jgi:hypothetical protein